MLLPTGNPGNGFPALLVRQEPLLLLEAQGAFSIKNYEELKELLDRMLADEVFLRETGTNAGYYVTSNAGATDKILSMINF